MADKTPEPTPGEEEELKNEAAPEDPGSSSSSDEAESDSDSDSDYESESSDSDSDTEKQKQPGAEPEDEGEDYFQSFDDDDKIPNTVEENVMRFRKILNSKQMKKYERQEEKEIEDHEDLFDFPKDRENWTEEDLQELWGDAPLGMTKPGWDPAWVDEDEVEVLKEEIKEGRDLPIAPFYVPYRKPYPAIPDNHYDISNPKSVIEELDRIEEFLSWVSFIFADGSTYEGTVWDDLAHGKGVYVGEHGLVRYEGEWLQNNMEGHGVVEVDIPDIEPVPGSKLEEKMRAEGKIIKRDYMSPEDREWLEMDIEDSIRLADGTYEIPFYENDEWIRQFGALPEKGRYRYAGQWKHGRMHGCGVYELNERLKYGRFYFGNLLEDSTGCDEDASAVHAGIAEVAAAKARMFVNKPDGMVREERGPYGDPQHPYFYEEEDVWMAPGFINQFYEVPGYWKTYVHEVDQEREMWLNSFIKAPLRLPMPAELEYWWAKDESPEFIVINKEPEPDPEDPSKLVYTEDPLIVHTPTGRIINYVEDEEHGVRLFWQPPLKEGEDVDPEKAEFLPLGFDEFYGTEEVIPKPNTLQRVLTAVENVCKPVLEKLEKWTEEQKKDSELQMTLIEKELELIDAEMDLEEEIEDMDDELKKIEDGVEEEVEDTNLDEVSQEEKGVLSPGIADQDKKLPPVEKEDEEEEDEDDDDDEDEPPSFGSVIGDPESAADRQNGKKSGKSPFSSLSLASCSILSPPRLASVGPPKLRWPFPVRKEGKLNMEPSPCPPPHPLARTETSVCLVSFPRTSNQWQKLRAVRQSHRQVRNIAVLCSGDPFSRKGGGKSKRGLGSYKSQEGVCLEEDLQDILSWHTSLDIVSR